MPKEEKPKVATEKKKRTKKDPNAPKKALSAFMIFSQENRSKIKEANPDASFGKSVRYIRLLLIHIILSRFTFGY